MRGAATRRRIALRQPSRPLSDFWQLLKRDRKLADLFYGRKPRKVYIIKGSRMD